PAARRLCRVCRGIFGTGRRVGSGVSRRDEAEGHACHPCRGAASDARSALDSVKANLFRVIFVYRYMPRLTTLLLFAVLALASVTTVHAQQGGGRGRGQAPPP